MRTQYALSSLSTLASRSFSILVTPTAPIPFSHPYRALIAPPFIAPLSPAPPPLLSLFSLSRVPSAQSAHTRARTPPHDDT